MNLAHVLSPQEMAMETVTPTISRGTIPLPKKLNLDHLIVAGPPCAGKTSLVNQLSGQRCTDSLDLARNNWWRSYQIQTGHPSEVTLALPFIGLKESLTVQDFQFINADPPLLLDFARIIIPPIRDGLFSFNWRKRIAFEFLIPCAQELMAKRIEKVRNGTFFAGRRFNLERLQQEVAVFQELAYYLHISGVAVTVREDPHAPPQRFTDTDC